MVEPPPRTICSRLSATAVPGFPFPAPLSCPTPIKEESSQPVGWELRRRPLLSGWLIGSTPVVGGSRSDRKRVRSKISKLVGSMLVGWNLPVVHPLLRLSATGVPTLADGEHDTAPCGEGARGRFRGSGWLSRGPLREEGRQGGQMRRDPEGSQRTVGLL